MSYDSGYISGRDNAVEEAKELKAEIERLRKELRYLVHTDEDIEVQNQEIARLRAHVAMLEQHIRDMGHTPPEFGT